MPGGKAEKITKKRNIEDLPDRKAKKYLPEGQTVKIYLKTEKIAKKSNKEEHQKGKLGRFTR